MATLAGGETPQKSSYASYRADQGFFLGLALALSLLTLLGFGQLAARGITDPIGAPFRVHAHALLLVGWLALFCTQNWLVYAGNIKLHRMLGWLGVALVAAILVANYQVTLAVIAEDRLGPGFTPASFLALGVADTFTFAGLIGWALVKRRDTQWHRRLMFGATLMVAAAGFNRLLGDVGGEFTQFLTIGTQLAFVAALAWHDRKALGRVHGATLAVGLVVLIQHAIPAVLPMIGLWQIFVTSLVGQ